MTNREGCGMERFWSVLRYFPELSWRGLEKQCTISHVSQSPIVSRIEFRLVRLRMRSTKHKIATSGD